jgi:hypothetical protein
LAALVVVVGGGLYYFLGIFTQSGTRDAIDQAIKQLPPGYTVTYKTADYSALSSRATLSGVVVHKAAPDPFDLAIDQIDVAKPAFDAGEVWSKALANPTAIPPDKALALANSVALKGVSFHNDQLSGSIDAVQVDGPRVYLWALLHPGRPSLSEAYAVLSQQNGKPQLDDMLPLLKLEAAIILGSGYDLYSVEGLKATVKLSVAAGGELVDVKYDIRKISGGGIDRGVMRDSAGEGFVITSGPTGTASVDRVAFAGLDMRKPLSQILAGEPLAPTMLDGITIDRIEYGGFLMHPPTGPQIALRSVSLSKLVFSGGGMPVSADFAFSGLKMNLADIPNPEAVANFKKLGIDTLTVSFGTTYTWDLAQKRVVLKDATLKIDELGALTLAAEVDEIAPGGLPIGARLVHGKLRYNDASLTERAINMSAADSHSDPGDYRKQIIAMVQAQGGAFGKDSPPIAAAVDAVVAFLKAPKSLTVELSPPAPVAVMALIGAAATPPPKLATMLGLAVTSND